MTDRGTIHQVSAGPYTLELPTNGVAILYEDGKQLPGGVGQLDALVQFAGEVIRLNSMIATIRADALEDAAHECDEEAKGSSGEVAFRDGCETCAGAIRLLKDKVA